MPKLICVICFFWIKISAFSQYALISFSNTPIDFLTDVNDTSLNKIIKKISILVTSNGETGESIELDVSNYVNKIFKFPDSLKNKTIVHLGFVLEFKGYLSEYFNSDTLFNSSNLKNFGFSPMEIEIVKKLSVFHTIDNRWEYDLPLLLTVKTSKGNKLEYFEVSKLSYTKELFAEYSSIMCEINYSPVFADIYIIPKKDWIYNYNLSDPPVGTEINKPLLQKLANFKITKCDSPISIELNEKSYIILYDKNGSFTFDHISPSTIYQTQNTLRSKL